MKIKNQNMAEATRSSHHFRLRVQITVLITKNKTFLLSELVILNCCKPCHLF